ncbi:unnamed protein product [Coffea canephora]|uniref:thymidine kinase n=1 Tax=Coffea canephora TaxID=49390 RepID=A0A068VJX7_COFCA|nr:unnamed protein product [Coffea canephora]
MRGLKSEATSAAASSSSSGEIHVIVGPMFAGKTSTLLRRIKTESSNGNFQDDAREIALQLDKSLKDLRFSGRVVEAVQMLCHVGVQAGDLNLVHILFDKLQMKSLVSCNSMIAGYAQKGLEEVGLSMFHEMGKNGLIPDHYTFASVFGACAALAILEQGRQAHALWIKCQMSGNLVVNSALMDKKGKETTVT